MSMSRDLGAMDWSKLNPQDIGVRIGKPLTEEEFRRYQDARKKAGGAVRVVPANQAESSSKGPSK